MSEKYTHTHFIHKVLLKIIYKNFFHIHITNYVKWMSHVTQNRMKKFTLKKVRNIKLFSQNLHIYLDSIKVYIYLYEL